jgi:hypothetical protein
MVALPVTGARQPVSGVLAAGDLERSGADVAGEVRRGGEARGPTGAAKQPAGDDRADAHGLGEPAAECRDGVMEPLLITASCRSSPRTSATSSQATCLRARSAAVTGWTVRSSAAALSARSLGGAPPATSSHSTAWSWLTLRVRWATRLLCRSSNTASTIVASLWL